MRSALFLLIAVAACEPDVSAPSAERIEVVSGDNQTGGQGSDLFDQIVVRVIDRGGAPMANVRVDWRVIAGGGTVIVADSVTDASGVAHARLSLGVDTMPNLLLVTAAGASRTIVARSEVQFTTTASGEQHSCAVNTIGDAYCWGGNDGGQLGDGTTNSRSYPSRVSGAQKYVSLTGGFGFTCGIASDGKSYCWGGDSDGQLGVGGTFRQLTPKAIVFAGSFTKLSLGFVHACGLTPSGEAWCWGSNGQRQLGNQIVEKTNVPLRVTTSLRFKDISAGEFHTCAITTDDSAYCWGSNSTGELGSGSAFGIVSAEPLRVAGTVAFSSISAGVRHTCAISKADSAAYCWGRNGRGETGLPPFLNTNVPSRVPGLLRFVALAADGNEEVCGTARDNVGELSIYCWGSEGFNQNLQPGLIFAKAGELSFGFDHGCAVQRGAVWCWGSNSRGKLGVEGITGSATPVRVQRPR